MTKWIKINAVSGQLDTYLDLDWVYTIEKGYPERADSPTIFYGLKSSVKEEQWLEEYFKTEAEMNCRLKYLEEILGVKQ